MSQPRPFPRLTYRSEDFKAGKRLPSDDVDVFHDRNKVYAQCPRGENDIYFDRNASNLLDMVEKAFRERRPGTHITPYFQSLERRMRVKFGLLVDPLST